METLAERIARDGPVSELDAIGWAIRLAKRLEALHALGVAHGSVSPACVIAAGQDRNARAYLADVQHTTPTPAYQSPERILGGDISAADDVWALAATLYALLTGQSPFSANADADVRQKILAAAPPPLAVYDVGDDDLQHILDHAFAREIGQRTAGITAFRRALEEWHPDRGVANLPPLEDEDSTNDDDDGARTMLVRDAGGYLQQVLNPGAPPILGPARERAPSAAGALPKVNEDDDDDNVRTMMRALPKDDLAGIIARATAAAEARQDGQAPHPHAPGSVGGRPAPFPAAPPGGPASVPRPFGPPRPAPGPPRPAPATMGEAPKLSLQTLPIEDSPKRPAQTAAGAPAAAAMAAPRAMGAQQAAPFAAPFPARPQAAPLASQGFPAAFGGRPAPVAFAEEDSADEDIRTVMRTPEQMIHEEESHDAPRTILLRDDDPWQHPQGPGPAAGNPDPRPRIPMGTLALDSSVAMGAPAPRPPVAMGAPAPKPPVAMGAPAPKPPAAGQPAPRAGPAWDGPAPAPTMALPAHYEPAAPNYANSAGIPSPDPLFAGPQGTQKIPPGLQMGPPQPLNQGAPPGQAVLGAAPPLQPVLGAAPLPNPMVLAAEPPRASKTGLVVAALIALLIAAAATFAFLKLKGL